MTNAELDQAIVECLGDPATMAYGNEVIDIITAAKNGEITQFEAQYLIMEMRDVRAAEALAGQEVALRYLVAACNLALKAV